VFISTSEDPLWDSTCGSPRAFHGGLLVTPDSELTDRVMHFGGLLPDSPTDMSVVTARKARVHPGQGEIARRPDGGTH
jgi:hypothetical protein